MTTPDPIIPAVLEWASLTEAQQKAQLKRKAGNVDARVSAVVAEIIGTVRVDGDAALIDYTERFDGVRLQQLLVSPEEVQGAFKRLTAVQLEAIQTAIDHVQRFHEAQRFTPVRVETVPGVRCELLSVPLRAVGVYVPAGSAPLPSAAIMSVVPARLAGVQQCVVCTPVRRDGCADAGVVVAATMAGAHQIFKVGGAQAIAAMAFGTETIPKVDKITGPGNRYVTEAKLQVANDPQGAAFDLPADPSEVMVITDRSANPTWVAADLLAQAEHDPDAQVILLSTDRSQLRAVQVALATQLPLLSRRGLCEQALANARLIYVTEVSTAVAIANDYAPEHLMLSIEDPRAWVRHIVSAGSVFLGHTTPETLGDYCSGTNHVLPTYGYAKAYSGLSLKDFYRTMSVQECSPEGLKRLGPVAITLAQLEGLDAHAQAVAIRLAQCV